MRWESPTNPNGWWPRWSPDGQLLAFGNARSFVADFWLSPPAVRELLPDVGPGRPWAGYWIGPGRLTFFKELPDAQGRSAGWERWEFKVGDALPVKVGEIGPATFFDAADGHWAANVPWGVTLLDGVPYPAGTGCHGVKLAGTWMLQHAPQEQGGKLRLHDLSRHTYRDFFPMVLPNEYTINAAGYIGVGYAGPACVIDPSGTQHDVTITPWANESAPHVVMVEEVPWVWTTTTIPATGESVALGRPLGGTAALVVPNMAGSGFSVRYRSADRAFAIAGCNALGYLTVETAQSASTLRQVLKPSVEPFPRPLYFGHFFAFSDRPGYGDAPGYPQNCTVVVEPAAAVRAARVLPVIVTPNCLEALQARGLAGKVLGLYIASEDEGGGAPAADRLARAAQHRWREVVGTQPPPVVWYVSPGEAHLPGWTMPESVGIVAPEFYFDFEASLPRMVDLLWRKLGFWIEKLGTQKPWMPIFQAYDRSRPDLVDMKAVAALQPHYLRRLVEVDPRIGKLPPAVGALFFSVNRPGGSRDYPEVAAWHRAMFAALPPGVPTIPTSGGSTVDPRVTITSYTPESGAAPLRVRAVGALEAGSGPVARFVWLYRKVGEAAWRIAANNSADDHDHTYTFQAGEWEIALQGHAPDGKVAQTGRRRVVRVGEVQPGPAPDPGRPANLPTYEQFVRTETPAVAAAFMARFSRLPNAQDLAHLAWRRLVEGWTHEAIIADLRGERPPNPNPNQPVPDPVPDGPISRPDPRHWPRYGASYQNCLGHPHCDLRELASRLRDVGCTLSRVWLIDAWAVGANGPGQYEGHIPVKRRDPFDLFDWEPRYFERLRSLCDEFNRVGIVPILTTLELYAWAGRKQGLLWVPDANRGPWRNNSNGVRWGDPDDPTFMTLPDDWFKEFLQRVVQTIDGTSNAIEIGNEMPEKPMHERIKSYLREIGYDGHLAVNRQEDTPGQYANMRVGSTYDLIAYHGKSELGYLDEDFPREPEHRTFRSFYDSGRYDAWRIMLSSDGCRKSTNVEDAYDYPRLLAVAQDAKRRGFGYEHQLAVKLRPFTHGELRLSDIDFDAEFLRTLTR